MGLNIAVLANLKRNAPKYEGMSDDAWDDLDSDVTIDAICSALRAGGHTATFLEGNLSLIETLPYSQAAASDLTHPRKALR